jgi:hypothetical protein
VPPRQLGRTPRHLPPYCHVIIRTPLSTAACLPRQRATSPADVIRATCHPVSGDTCHFRIGPSTCRKRQNCLTRVAFRCCHVSCTDPATSSYGPATSSYGPATCRPLVLPRHLYGPATCRLLMLPRHCTDAATSAVRTGTCLYGLYGQVQSAKSKFCLFGSADRMRYLPHTDSVCDKNYTTGIRKTSRTSWCWFRRIPSTFIFEHFSCPDGSWIRFLIMVDASSLNLIH